MANSSSTIHESKYTKPLSFELWPALYDIYLPILKNKLISGDMVLLQTSDPSLVQQYKNGYFAPGVLVYSVFRSKGVDDIETSLKNLPAGFDIIKEDYESGPTYEPSFVIDESQSLAIFYRCHDAVHDYNLRTGSHALLWITPSYREISGENWNWGPIRQIADILQVQTQPWQESDPSRSLEAALHVNKTGAYDFIAQTSVTGNHTAQGVINLAQNLGAIQSIKAVAVFTNRNNTAETEQVLNQLR